jgi:hypothetical protein
MSVSKYNKISNLTRGGHGSGESDIGQNRCPSVENKYTDNPSVNHPLINTGQSDRLSGFGRWMSGGLVEFNWACKWFLAQFKKSVHITFLGHFKSKSATICNWVY